MEFIMHFRILSLVAFMLSSQALANPLADQKHSSLEDEVRNHVERVSIDQKKERGLVSEIVKEMITKRMSRDICDKGTGNCK
jgi:hypothetical protein